MLEAPANVIIVGQKASFGVTLDAWAAIQEVARAYGWAAATPNGYGPGDTIPAAEASQLAVALRKAAEDVPAEDGAEAHPSVPVSPEAKTMLDRWAGARKK